MDFKRVGYCAAIGLAGSIGSSAIRSAMGTPEGEANIPSAAVSIGGMAGGAYVAIQGRTGVEAAAAITACAASEFVGNKIADLVLPHTKPKPDPHTKEPATGRAPHEPNTKHPLAPPTAPHARPIPNAPLTPPFAQPIPNAPLTPPRVTPIPNATPNRGDVQFL